MTDLAISHSDIAAAAARLLGVAHRTPVFTSRTADQRTGAQVYFKCENFQRMGAFKFRGAYNALAQFTPEQRRAGVIAFSSGNHAQAIALAARLLGMPSVIVMPHDSPAAKLAATREYQQGQPGSEVVLYDRFTEDREAIGARLAAERGMTLIPPYDHAHVMAGQGTAADELIDETGPLDLLLVCVGGGGLIAGCAVAAAHRSPGHRRDRRRARSRQRHPAEPGARRDRAHRHAADHRRRRADAAQRPADFPRHPAPGEGHRDRERRATRDHDALLCRAHEDGGRAHRLPGRGCAAGRRDRPRGQRVGVIVSGGNVDLARYAGFLATG